MIKPPAPLTEALSSCFPLIKTLSPEGSVLIVGNLMSDEVKAEFKTFFLEKHLRQILFWQTPECKNDLIIKTQQPYSLQHLWARSPHSLSWNHVGHFDVIWLLPDALQTFDLKTMKTVFQAVCQQSHFTILCPTPEKIKVWMKQAGLKRTHQQKKHLQNLLNPPEKNLYFKEMEAFFATQLPGIFWGLGSASHQNLFQFIATQKPHPALALENLQQELNETIAIETALNQEAAIEALSQQQQAEAQRIEKANQLAKLLSKKTLSL